MATFSGIKVPKKKERALSGDEKMTGAEPTWTGAEVDDEYNE